MADSTAQGIFLSPLADNRSANRSVSSASGLPSSSLQHREAMSGDGPKAQDTTSSGGGFFSNARNFKIENAYMYDYSGTEDARSRAEHENQVQAALEKLASQAMPSAMLNSKEHVDAPRCIEGTRVTLRRLIIKWGRDLEELQRLLWLFGPTGVGKSAVARTVAEELKEEDRLGAVFFFSHPNNRSDPDAVVPTLVCQLVRLLPSYRLIVAQRIISDPLVLTESRDCQFTAFITDPFLTFLSQRPLTFLYTKFLDEITNRPLCIVLDGLDECNNSDAQREFVEMISNHAKDDTSSRLRWMICSRPEPHIKNALADVSKAIYRQEELKVDDKEAQEDAGRILETSFFQIRKRYPDQLDHDWPDQTDVRLIAEQASGHLGFVSFILRFIGDKNYNDPSGQLDVCVRFLKDPDHSQSRNPLQALDLLYTHILSSIPRDILPTTQRILALLILYGGPQLTALVHANFLGLNRAAFYRSLHCLHSVLFVPPAPEAHAASIQIYHASFSDYLRDSSRAQQFAFDEGAVHVDVAIRGLEWLKHRRKYPSVVQRSQQELTWAATKSSDMQELLYSVCDYSFAPCWRAFPKVPKNSLSTLKTLLKNFDFNLDYSKWQAKTKDFVYFIRWLHSPEAETLALINPQHAKLNLSEGEENIVVQWHDQDPYTFVQPFRRVEQLDDRFSVHLQLATCAPITFRLIIGDVDFRRCYPVIDGFNVPTSEDDIVIAFMGTAGCGKSYFIDLLTGERGRRAGDGLKSVTSKVEATRIKHHPKYGRRIVLVDTPGFDDTYRTDREILAMIGEWLGRTYKGGIRLTGLIWLHRITDNRMAGSPYKSLQMFSKLCGDQGLSRVTLVSTMWERIDPSAGEKREAELKQQFWRGLLDAGSTVDRLQSSEMSEAWRVVDSIVERCPAKEAILLQQGIVDLQRDVGETEANKVLSSDLQRLLDEQRESIKSLLAQVEKSNDPKMKEALQKEYNKIEREFQKTFKEINKLKIPIGKRIKLLFSFRKRRSRAIGIATMQD